MTKLIIEDDKGNLYVYRDADVSIDWEADPIDRESIWPISPFSSRPRSASTTISASTRSPAVRVDSSASESTRLAALGLGEDMKLVRRGKEIAFYEIQKGDRVRVEWNFPNDDITYTREEVADRPDSIHPPAFGAKVYLLERAPFKLPTTPGSVVRVETVEDCDGAADYVLGLDRLWRGGENGSTFHEDYFEGHFDGDPQILVGGES